MIFIELTLVIYVLTSVICVYALCRNNKVYDFRKDILLAIHNCVQTDIQNNLPWKWRYTMFEKVSYDQMFYSLRSLKLGNYYKDTTFVEPTNLESKHE
jgi:hypothetical protein